MVQADTRNISAAFRMHELSLMFLYIQVMLLNNPMVPLTFRAIIWVLSLLALALAVSVYQYSNEYGVSQKPSTVMAIVVDVVALIYLDTVSEVSGEYSL
ncbi:hypothetical protein BDZ91DRAFT_721560 [Kalaharituber pfeilii]|nr:hypothetical protein BDZ91DRAFT_721560 [Kalaharituber pfeilii]